MPTTFQGYLPNQPYLMPPDLGEWLPEGHLAYRINDLVEQLDLSAFFAPYEGDGRRNQPYHPAMMAKVLLYGYATGVFSSRKIAAKLTEDVAFRVLAAGNFPNFRTVSEFRRRHLADFQRLFVQVVQVAQRAGMVKLGRLSVDGTKVRANANRHKAMSYGRMRQAEVRLAAEIKGLLESAEQADADDDCRYGADLSGDEVAEELRRRETRLSRIRQAKEELEREQRAADVAAGRRPGQRRNAKGGQLYKRAYGEPPARAQKNFTDPQSRIMKTHEGWQQCLNAQVAVDCEQQLIAACSVSSKGSDQGQLSKMLDQTRQHLGDYPKQVLADAGYRSESELVAVERRGVDGYVALGREGKAAAVDGERSPASGRMARKLASASGQQIYRQRKWLSEAPHGWVKQVLGFRQFSLRGLNKAEGEWALVCLALNVRRISRLDGVF